VKNARSDWPQQRQPDFHWVVFKRHLEGIAVHFCETSENVERSESFKALNDQSTILKYSVGRRTPQLVAREHPA